MKHKCILQLLLWIQTKQKHPLQTERSCTLLVVFRLDLESAGSWAKLCQPTTTLMISLQYKVQLRNLLVWLSFRCYYEQRHLPLPHCWRSLSGQRIYYHRPGARRQRTIPRCLVSMHQPVGAFLEVQGNILSVRQMALKLWLIILLKYPLHLLPNS